MEGQKGCVDRSGGGSELHPRLLRLRFARMAHRFGALGTRGHFVPRLGSAFAPFADIIEGGGFGGGMLFGGTRTVESGIIGQGLLLFGMDAAGKGGPRRSDSPGDPSICDWDTGGYGRCRADMQIDPPDPGHNASKSIG